jgi:hypothetical protein
MLEYRGMLIHVTRIDPAWLPKKETEPPFDLDVALELAANKDSLLERLHTAGPEYA